MYWTSLGLFAEMTKQTFRLSHESEILLTLRMLREAFILRQKFSHHLANGIKLKKNLIKQKQSTKIKQFN